MSSTPNDVQPAASPQHRIIFTNQFEMKFGDNDVAIGFCVDVGRDGLNGSTREVTVLMTPRSAKMLAHALNTAIRALEAAQGPIVMPEGKLEGLEKAMRAVTEKPPDKS
jgi:hypothetical protein